MSDLPIRRYLRASSYLNQEIEFGQRCKSSEVTAIFDGVVLNHTENPNLVIDAITVKGVKDLDFAGEFVKFVWGCDELEISSQQLYAWWD